jgi:hypothetical protein
MSLREGYVFSCTTAASMPHSGNQSSMICTGSGKRTSRTSAPSDFTAATAASNTARVGASTPSVAQRVSMPTRSPARPLAVSAR